MAVAREAEPVNSLSEVKEAGLDRDDLLGAFRNMLITRGIEERGHILYKQGKIPGSFYTGRGNEAAAVGIATAMGPEDVGTPLHRDMGVHVVRGVEPWRIFAQFMGRIDGPTQGKDGNVHMADDRLGLIAMVSHLPAMLPVAVGCALAFRIREEKRVALGWFGEGASARGDTHEAMNFAGVRRLPIVFICDNNQWAYSTPTHLEYAIEHIADRAKAYGFDGVVVDGTDVLAVYREAKMAIEKAREGGGPTLLELQTLRMEGHAVHDDAFYVPKEMFEKWAAYDPIERYRTWLQANADMSDDEEGELAAQVGQRRPKRLRAGAVVVRERRVAGRAGGEGENGVAGRGVAVDGDAREARRIGLGQCGLEKRGLDRRICEDEAEHRCHVRRDHPQSLDDADQSDGPIADHRGRHRALGEGIGGHDRCGSILPAARCGRERGVEPRFRLVDRQRHADHAGRGHENVRRLAPEMRRRPRRDRLDRRPPTRSGERVGISRIHDQRPRLTKRQRRTAPLHLGRRAFAGRQHARHHRPRIERHERQVAPVPRLVLRACDMQRDSIDRRDGGEGQG